MNIRNWPYWIKGGMIGLVIPLFAFILMMFVDELPAFLNIVFLPVVPVVLILPLVFIALGDSINQQSTAEAIASIVTIGFLFIGWFLIGAIVGKIYAIIKIKSQNQNLPPQM
jgi:hypothetical protein